MQKLIYSIINNAGKAEIRIVGYIGSWDANSERFMNQIDDLIASGVEDLDVYLNSFGGSVLEANEITNQLSRFKGTKTVQVGAIAASAASYILPYFDKVKAFKNTQVMVHNPIMRPELKSESDFESARELYDNSKTTIVDAYAKKMTSSKEEIIEMMAKTTWMGSAKAKELGLIDEIVDQEDKLPQNVGSLSNAFQGDIPAELRNSIEQSEKQKKKINMKTVLIALGLAENASEQEALAKVNSIKQNAINSLKALGENKGFTPEQIEKLGASDYSTTLEMIVGKEATPPTNIPPATPTEPINIVDALANAMKGKTDTPKKASDYSPAELEALFEKSPEEYNKIVNQL